MSRKSHKKKKEKMHLIYDLFLLMDRLSFNTAEQKSIAISILEEKPAKNILQNVHPSEN